MSRSSRTRNTRVVRNNANLRLSFHPRPMFSNPFSSLRLTQLEDRRLFHPDGLYRPARTLATTIAPIRSSSPSHSRVPVGVSFSAPNKVLTCVRRTRRRQVLFARGGAGRRRMRRPVHSYYSSVRC